MVGLAYGPALLGVLHAVPGAEAFAGRDREVRDRPQLAVLRVEAVGGCQGTRTALLKAWRPSGKWLNSDWTAQPSSVGTRTRYEKLGLDEGAAADLRGAAAAAALAGVLPVVDGDVPGVVRGRGHVLAVAHEPDALARGSAAHWRGETGLTLCRLNSPSTA